MRIIEKHHINRRAKKFLHTGIPIKYIEMTDKDLYDFSNPIFKMANRKRYDDGLTYLADGFGNSIMDKFSDKAYEEYGKRTGHTKNKLKRKILHETTKAMAKLMIENDDSINLLDNKIIMHIGYKEKYKKLDLDTMLRIQSTPYPLIEIIHEDPNKFNVFMQMEFTRSMRRLFNKFKTIRSYARKSFIHNT
jgi:hypothetical protein